MLSAAYPPGPSHSGLPPKPRKTKKQVVALFLDYQMGKLHGIGFLKSCAMYNVDRFAREKLPSGCHYQFKILAKSYSNKALTLNLTLLGSILPEMK